MNHFYESFLSDRKFCLFLCRTMKPFYWMKRLFRSDLLIKIDRYLRERIRIIYKIGIF